MMTRKVSELNQQEATVQTIRKVFLCLCTAVMIALVTIGPPAAYGRKGWDDEHERGDHDAYAIGLWGDLPYSTVQATVGVPNLIADMNKQDLVFTAHDGDLKSGSSECTDAVYTQALGYFKSLRAPAVFTPGDNDWTDCDRTAGSRWRQHCCSS